MSLTDHRPVSDSRNIAPNSPEEASHYTIVEISPEKACASIQSHPQKRASRRCFTMHHFRYLIVLFVTGIFLSFACCSAVIRSTRRTADELAFQQLLSTVSDASLHDILVEYVDDKYKPGVYHEDRSAMEALHHDDAAMATTLIELARRQNTNATTSSPGGTAAVSPTVTTTTTTETTEATSTSTSTSTATVAPPTTSDTPPPATTTSTTPAPPPASSSSETETSPPVSTPVSSSSTSTPSPTSSIEPVSGSSNSLSSVSITSTNTNTQVSTTPQTSSTGPISSTVPSVIVSSTTTPVSTGTTTSGSAVTSAPVSVPLPATLPTENESQTEVIYTTTLANNLVSTVSYLTLVTAGQPVITPGATGTIAPSLQSGIAVPRERMGWAGGLAVGAVGILVAL